MRANKSAHCQLSFKEKWVTCCAIILLLRQTANTFPVLLPCGFVYSQTAWPKLWKWKIWIQTAKSTNYQWNQEKERTHQGISTICRYYMTAQIKFQNIESTKEHWNKQNFLEQLWCSDHRPKVFVFFPCLFIELLAWLTSEDANIIYNI